MGFEDEGKARKTVLRGIAAYSEVDDMVTRIPAVEFLLDKIRVALARIEAEPGGETVAKTRDDRAEIGGVHGMAGGIAEIGPDRGGLFGRLLPAGTRDSEGSQYAEFLHLLP